LLFSYSISAIQPQLGLYCNTHVVADSQCHCMSVLVGLWWKRKKNTSLTERRCSIGRLWCNATS